MDETAQRRLSELAAKIMRGARNNLMLRFGFLYKSLDRLRETATFDIPSCEVDGECIYYNPEFIIHKYKLEKSAVDRLYLHAVFHCVFRHFNIGKTVIRRYWDLAADIMIENIINELNNSVLNVKSQPLQEAEAARLKGLVNYMTAEVLYDYFMHENLSESECLRLHEIFIEDTHDFWYVKSAEGATGITEKGCAGNSGDEDENERGFADSTGVIRDESLINDWKDISDRIKVELETFAQGKYAGNLAEILTIKNRKKADYSGFLRRFSASGEALKINEDEFDYIFYTYGLKIYDKMPLIEALEYKEVRKIKEFVIAIDTSGSVRGNLVKKFLEKTYEIFSREENFFTKINIHIIQCDAKIQNDVKITTRKEFVKYIEEVELLGFGGTDFRPVFTYVDEMIKNKEFTNLKGLIYFTDGYGTFPSRKPPYETAFIFVEEPYRVNEVKVPYWAIKLNLTTEEIGETA